MAAEAPSARIGRRSALEMDTPERTTQTASRNVVALKNRMGHQVDADSIATESTAFFHLNFKLNPRSLKVSKRLVDGQTLLHKS